MRCLCVTTHPAAASEAHADEAFNELEDVDEDAAALEALLAEEEALMADETVTDDLLL